MFEDNELFDKSLNSQCSFCGKDIKLIPIQSLDDTLKFCDIICAKLYYDNVHHFIFNTKLYNNYFVEGQLSKSAAAVYERARYIIFEQLPIYKPLPNEVEFNNPELMYKRYKNI